jgi:hypothetical protein
MVYLMISRRIIGADSCVAACMTFNITQKKKRLSYGTGSPNPAAKKGQFNDATSKAALKQTT